AASRWGRGCASARKATARINGPTIAGGDSNRGGRGRDAGPCGWPSCAHGGRPRNSASLPLRGEGQGGGSMTRGKRVAARADARGDAETAFPSPYVGRDRE